MHGVNLDQLGRRDPALYGTLTLAELERRDRRAGAASWASRRASSRPTTRARSSSTCTACASEADAILLNPGAWTHYAWAIRDALEIAALPAVEVHLSDVHDREQWRRTSVIGELCFATVSGRGPDGYREALALLRERLDGERRAMTGDASARQRRIDALARRSGRARARRAARRPRRSTCAT